MSAFGSYADICNGPCLLWVRNRHMQCNRPCPPYPQKRTLARRRLNLAVHGLEGDVRHGGNVNS